jgi:hypothetical protein
VARRLQRDVLLISETSNATSRKAIIVEAFGEPVQTYASNTWQINRYHPL